MSPLGRFDAPIDVFVLAMNSYAAHSSCWLIQMGEANFQQTGRNWQIFGLVSVVAVAFGVDVDHAMGFGPIASDQNRQRKG